MESSRSAAFRHVTVLRDEAVELLVPTTSGFPDSSGTSDVAAGAGRLIVDGTLGGGGHAEALLERGARVIGLDRDPRALAAASERLSRFGDRFTPIHTDFRDVVRVLQERGVPPVDGVLVDLGVSSPQLDEAHRGFSFSRPGPLDMRMDPTSGEPLSEWLGHVDERALADVIRRLGEEPLAGRVARAILRARDEGRLTDTRVLSEVVADAIPRKAWPKVIHPATRTFQALRIAVNDELGALDAWLESLPELLAPGGRACAISFHSLEDRAVKRRFAELSKGCVCPPDFPVCGCGRSAGWRLLTRRAVTADEEAVEANPRARSARLRCIERIDDGATTGSKATGPRGAT